MQASQAASLLGESAQQPRRAGSSQAAEAAQRIPVLLAQAARWVPTGKVHKGIQVYWALCVKGFWWFKVYMKGFFCG